MEGRTVVGKLEEEREQCEDAQKEDEMDQSDDADRDQINRF